METNLLRKKLAKYATPKLLKSLSTASEEEAEVIKEILNKRGVELSEPDMADTEEGIHPEATESLDSETILKIEEKITSIIEEDNKEKIKELLDALGGTEDYSLLTKAQASMVLSISDKKPEKKEKKPVKKEIQKKVAEAVKKQIPAASGIEEMVDAIYKLEIPSLTKTVMSFLDETTYKYEELPEGSKEMISKLYSMVFKGNPKEKFEKFNKFVHDNSLSKEITLYGRVKFMASPNSKTPKKEITGWATSVFYDKGDNATYYYILGDNGTRYCKTVKRVQSC